MDMDILYFLIPLAVVLMIVAVAGLVWAIRSGQFEDMDGPAYRILMDDDDPRIPGKSTSETSGSSSNSGRISDKNSAKLPPASRVEAGQEAGNERLNAGE